MLMHSAWMKAWLWKSRPLLRCRYFPWQHEMTGWECLLKMSGTGLNWRSAAHRVNVETKSTSTLPFLSLQNDLWKSGRSTWYQDDLASERLCKNARNQQKSQDRIGLNWRCLTLGAPSTARWSYADLSSEERKCMSSEDGEIKQGRNKSQCHSVQLEIPKAICTTLWTLKCCSYQCHKIHAAFCWISGLYRAWCFSYESHDWFPFWWAKPFSPFFHEANSIECIMCHLARPCAIRPISGTCWWQQRQWCSCHRSCQNCCSRVR